MITNDLIRDLAAVAVPVRPLRTPWRRTRIWFGICVPFIAAIVAFNLRPADLVFDSRFAFEETAIFLTSVTAAVAAFSSVIPGHDKRIYLAPLLPLAVWLVSLGDGCVSDWMRLGPEGLYPHSDEGCARLALIVSAVPALAMVIMLRRGAPMVPRISVALGALAVGALANFGLRIFHVGDVSIVMLTWHFGGLALFSIVAGRLGDRVMSWRSARARSSCTAEPA